MTKTSRSPAPARRRSAFASPIVWVVLLLLLGIAGWYGFQWWRAKDSEATNREQLLTDVATAIAAQPVDTSGLSRLMASLQKLPDHDSARDLLAAQARIELVRERPERAMALFGGLARQPGAAPADQGLGARILLASDQIGGSDIATARGTLLEAAALADTAYTASRDAADLLCAWQAAIRAPDLPQAEGFAKRLQAEQGDTPAAKLVAAVAAFPKVERSLLADLRSDLAPAPAELDAMDALLVLQAGDLAAARDAADALLVRAPGVIAARWSAATVFHAWAFGFPAGSDDRNTWLVRRDAQLDWLLRRAPADDPRRARWSEVRSQH